MESVHAYVILDNTYMSPHTCDCTGTVIGVIHNRAGSIGIHGGGETHLVSHSAMDERYADDTPPQSNLLFLTALGA